MAASNSSSLSFFGASQADRQLGTQIRQQQNSSAPPQAAPPQKKRRNLPGNPIDPDAQVIALSPKTLMATNRFICEVCNKGFQREQNLQLHRRGHNLPWKLKQKSTKEVRRKVYLCPEPTCVHHDPSRALGDLTGIKKHFFRKHGEKKWRCEKCSKRYAVQSDWKAHSKTCGTKEYRCDCGTLFSRRDSFITHRAFCDALAQESSRHPTGLYGNPNQMNLSINSQMSSASILQLCNAPRTPKFEHMNNISCYGQHYPPQALPSSGFFIDSNANNLDFHQEQSQHGMSGNKQSLFHGLMELPDHVQGTNSPSGSTTMFNIGYYAGSRGSTTVNNGFSSVAGTTVSLPESLMRSEDHQISNAGFGSRHFSAMYDVNGTSLQQADNMVHMSATALLQKATQMGSTASASNSSSLRRGLASSTKSDKSHPSTSLVTSNSSAVGGQETLKSFSSILDSEGLMNGNSSIFNGGGLGQNGGFMSRMFSGSNNNMTSSNFGKGIRGENENKLTLDFLGVGGMVRNNINGGYSQLGEIHQGVIEFNSLSSGQLKSSSPPANLLYSGGELQ